MQLTIKSPTRVYFDQNNPVDIEAIEKQLKYVNTANQHALKRHYNARFFKSKNPAAWSARLEELKGEVNKTTLFRDDSGTPYFRPGSISYLEGSFEVKNEVKYPEPKKVPWAKVLPFDLYPYQNDSVNRLIAIRHGNVQICTGAGKSAIILKICRETGFRAAIVAPSKAIFQELLHKFEYHFGKGQVGAFGDSKKTLDKRFTICIGDSLTNVKPGTREWEFFNGLDLLAVDESHTWGADTLEEICHGIFSEVPYRMFFSATQTRGDGAEKLLHSMIGQTVATLTTAEAVAGGYICQHDYTIVTLDSSNPHYQTREVLEMKRAHFLRNKNIAKFVAKLANAMATTRRQQTLVLVEELSQISALLPLLEVPVAYAHSEKGKDKLEALGLQKVNSLESVEKFNKGEAMVLIGTSCIATGTNIFPTHHTANWVGGASEIKTKQGAVGRSVRLGDHNPWKDKVTKKDKSTIWDFDVEGIYEMERHLESRIECYKESNSEIRRIKIS